MHEIITLQFGPCSNYIGTHLWNIQESYFTYDGEEESIVDHNVHFRSGTGADGSDTFTPRALIYDFKSSFGTLSKANTLYKDEASDDVVDKLWDGQTKVQKQPEISKHAFQDFLDEGTTYPGLQVDSVRYWSDYNKLYYHPRSIVQLNDNEISGLKPFETWQTGEELFDRLDRENEMYDHDFRHFVEECDQLQGLQILTGVDDAWGGFASRYADRLRDDFEKSSIWIWGIENTSKRNLRLSITNLAKSLSALPGCASMYVPLTDQLPRHSDSLQVNWSSPWCKSALQVTAIESVTLPSRLKVANRKGLTHIEQSLNAFDSRNIASLALGIPSEQALVEDEHSVDLSYNTIYQNKTYFHRFEVCRGLDIDKDITVNDYNVVDQRFRTPLPFPILDSFPPIFKNVQKEKPSLATNTRLSTSAATGLRLNWIIDRIKPLLDVSEREEICNSLSSLAQTYSNHSEFHDEGEEYESN